MRLVQTHPARLLGCEDEAWWSRVTQPHPHAWTADGQPLLLMEQTVAKHGRSEGDPKALACYGLRARWYPSDAPPQEAIWLRFVQGRPLSGVMTQYLAWCCEQAAAPPGTTALLLVWDNVSWHVRAQIRTWLRAHSQAVKAAGTGVRLLACPLCTNSPWRNPIEPKWVHPKRAVVEPLHEVSR